MATDSLAHQAPRQQLHALPGGRARGGIGRTHTDHSRLHGSLRPSRAERRGMHDQRAVAVARRVRVDLGRVVRDLNGHA